MEGKNGTIDKTDKKRKNGLIRRFAEEEDAVGVVEIILILVVLIGLVIISKSS